MSKSLAPASITSDLRLEQSLTFSTNKRHYVGLLLNKKKNSPSYFPTRLSPYKEGLKKGWNDPNYSNVSLNGTLKKADDKESEGIVVPLGYEIEVVEIVESKTGTWVGFLTDLNKNEIFYTKSQYVRIKQEYATSSPDPYISQKTLDIPKSTKISPGDNQDWTGLADDDVRLSYHNFNEYNEKTFKDVVLYTPERIQKDKTLRLSEGHYYFIVADEERPSFKDMSWLWNSVEEEEEPSVIEEQKKKISSEVMSIIKSNAWKNLLRYLGKNTEGGNENIRESIYNNYFVPVSAKLNTATVSPNNQKVLFAVRASYIDGLADSVRHYNNRLDSKSDFEAQFVEGRNYSIVLPVNKIKEYSDKLKEILNKIKGKISGTNLKITNANDFPYDINAQINNIKEFSNIIDNFMQRQSAPASSNIDNINKLTSEGISTKFNHLLQIGLKDNKVIGCNSRQTISYMLFSPDPVSLKKDDSDIDLFNFDPYIPENTAASKLSTAPRSAFPLNTGLSYLRKKLEGAYSSRTLHYILSYYNIVAYHDKKMSNATTNNWVEFLQAYTVPPLKIYLSQDPLEFPDPEELDCLELINRLNESSTVVGYDELALQEKIFNNPKCAEAYFNKYKDAIPAADPHTNRQALEDKKQATEESLSGGDPGNSLRLLYTGFMNNLDPISLLPLILACIQSKLGVEFTASALCDAAMIELINSVGVEEIERRILEWAMSNPEDENAQTLLALLGNNSILSAPATTEEESPGIKIDDSFNGAFVATTLAQMANDIPSSGDIPEYLSASAIRSILNLEKKGININYARAQRPNTIKDLPKNEAVGHEGTLGYLDVLENDYEKYTTYEIEIEKTRLFALGYTKNEVDASLIKQGMLIPDLIQVQSTIASKTTVEINSLASRNRTEGSSNSSQESQQENSDAAKKWLELIKQFIDIGYLCEILMGEFFDGMEDLFSDPNAFLFGDGAGGMLGDFVENLKRPYLPPGAKLKFPDRLATDNFMGDYGLNLLNTILSSVAIILGQILNLIITEALQNCSGDPEDGLGPAGRPLPKPLPPFNFDSGSYSNNSFSIAGVTNDEATRWIQDIINNCVSIDQICSLLKGEASSQTLNACLSRTKEKWINIYNSGIDTIYEVRIAFEKIGKNVNLDVCEAISLDSPIINDVCSATFDRDARCRELSSAGLTQEECDAQIDQEITNLKNKLLSLSPFLFSNISPVSHIGPTICGENGSFVIPPGVKDTMERITDSYLDTIKGSMIDDLHTLKFLSMPPRAVLAANDPDELLSAHRIFSDQANKPNKKDCVIYVGMGEHTNRSSTGVNQSFGSGVYCYPLIYNSYLHFGHHSTLGSTIDNPVNANRIAYENRILIPDQTSYQTLGNLKEVSKRYLNWKGGPGDNNEEYKNKHATPEQIFDYERLVPIDITNVIRTPTFLMSPEATKERNSYTVLKALCEEILSDPTSDVSLSSSTKAGLLAANQKLFFDYLMSGPIYIHLRDALYEKIKSSFTETIKPLNLDKMVVTLDHLLAWGESWPYLNIDHVNLTNPFVAQSDFTGYLRSLGAVPLSTKLKDICDEPRRWVHMCQNFTGVSLGGLLSKFHAWLIDTYTIGPDGTVEDYTIHTARALLVTKYQIEQWSDNEDFFGDDVDAIVAQENAILVATGNFYGSNTWFRFIETIKWSPGMTKLLPIMVYQASNSIALARVDAILSHSLGTLADPVDPDDINDDYRDDHPVLRAFMEMTLGEVTGLSDANRVKEIFPNLSTPEVFSSLVLGLIDKAEYNLVSWHGSGISSGNHYASVDDIHVGRRTISYGGEDNNVGLLQISPVYAVMTEGFRNPDSILSNPEDALSHFSMSDKKVNPELYQELKEATPFYNLESPYYYYFNDSQQVDNLEFIDAIYKDVFNPNIIKYSFPMPGVRVTASKIPGVDFEKKSGALLDTLGNLNYNNDNLDSISRATRNFNTKNTLIYQNISFPIQSNLNSQAKSIQDIQAIAKGKINSSFTVPESGVLWSDRAIDDPVYMTKINEDLDNDVQNLINDLYGTSVNAGTLIENWPSVTSQIVKTSYANSDVAMVDQLNFRAQLFAKFMKNKFSNIYNKYSDTNTWQVGNEEIPSDKVIDMFEGVLSTHCFSALQFAYTDQMFSRLKHSRIHSRKNLRKLWNKILKKSLGKYTSNPNCGTVTERIDLTTKEQLDKTETDFFELDKIKTSVLDFYEKSLCQDVYEQNAEQDNAARMSLIEGCLMLIVKIYTLEVCMASIISWDCFDIEEVVEDGLITDQIITNIKKDYNLQLFSYFINDIVKKDLRMSDAELALFVQDQSALEYMIKKESKDIARTIKGFFSNSNPVSLDLRLNILKNSDPDFMSAREPHHGPARAAHLGGLNRYEQSQLSVMEDLDFKYVVDVSLENNHYTMNYGNGQQAKPDFAPPVSVKIDPYGMRPEHKNLSGEDEKFKSNKNMIHSVPYTWYGFKTGLEQKVVLYLDDTKYMTLDHANSNHHEYLEMLQHRLLRDPPDERQETNLRDQVRRYRKMNDAQDKLGPTGFELEAAQQFQYGTNINDKFGNFIFQSYVKVEKTSASDRAKYSVNTYTDQNTGEICQLSPSDVINAASPENQGFFSFIENYCRDGITSSNGEYSNIFNCEIDDYVPLPVWSYFYNNIFLPRVNRFHGENSDYPIKKLFDKHGLDPFFKIKFGMRLVYTVASPITEQDYARYAGKNDTFSGFSWSGGLGHGDGFHNFINSSFNDGAGLKKSKSIFTTRPYLLTDSDAVSGYKKALLGEVHIPVYEAEREIVFLKNKKFKLSGDNKSYSIDELGFYGYEGYSWPPANHVPITVDSILNTSNHRCFKHLINTPHQFYYKHVAEELLEEVKLSAEFKFLFQYIFPMRRYMALAFLYSADGLTKYLRNPDNLLEQTKDRLQTITDGLVNSIDYSYEPSALEDALKNYDMASQSGTRGKEPDLSNKILELLLKTPLLILKGFVEVTDPAIIIAKAIIDTAGLIQQATIAAAESVLRDIKSGIEMSFMTAEASIATLEANLKMVMVTLNSLKGTLPSEPPELKNSIILPDTDAPIESWAENMQFNVPESVKSNLDQTSQDMLEGFETKFEQAKLMAGEYAIAKESIIDLQQQLNDIQSEIDDFVEEGKEIMKDLFSSPYLLPAMWAAMLPSMFPYGGGLIPPPFMGGPPSTFPGMIYLALLFIDAIEEKLEEEAEHNNTENGCEEEL